MKKKLVILFVVIVLLFGSFSTKIYAGTGDILTYIAEKLLGDGDNDGDNLYDVKYEDCSKYVYNPITDEYDKKEGQKATCIPGKRLSQCVSNGNCE